MGRQYCSKCVTSGRPTGSNTIGFMPALSGHSRVSGDKTGHWLASWLAGRPGKPLSGCWLASRSPAELSRFLSNRPATSRSISNQQATGQPSGSNRLERSDKLQMGRQWVAISRTTAKAGSYRRYCRSSSSAWRAMLRSHALFKHAYALNNMAARKLLHSQNVLAQQLPCE